MIWTASVWVYIGYFRYQRISDYPYSSMLACHSLLVHRHRGWLRSTTMLLGASTGLSVALVQICICLTAICMTLKFRLLALEPLLHHIHEIQEALTDCGIHAHV